MSSATESAPPRAARPRRDNGAPGGATQNPAELAAANAQRLPPHSLEAEQGLLGSILIAPDEWIDRCVEQITEKAFYFPAHQTIFEVVVGLRNVGKPVELITILQTLRDKSSLEAVGGPAALSHLYTVVPTAANAAHYLEIVREKYVLRQVITVCTECASSSYDPGMEANAVLDEVERKVLAIAETRNQASIPTMKEDVLKAIQTIETLYERRGQVTGLATGFTELDRMTNGLHGSEMFVIAARPSMGKCVAAGTEILLSDGSLARIEDVVAQQQADLLTLGDDWRLRPTQPSGFLDDGEKPTLRLITQSGRTLEATLPHPLLTPTGWKPLGTLRLGDHIAVPRHLPVFGNTEVRPCEVTLLAYLLGDGGLTDHCPEFTNLNPLLRDEFAAACDEFGGLAVARIEDGRRTPSLRVRAASEDIAEARTAFAQEFVVHLQRSGRSRRAVALAAGVSPASMTNWSQGAAVPAEDVLERLRQALQIPTAFSAFTGPAALRKNDRNPLTRWLESLGLWGCKSAAKFVPPFVFRLPRPQLAQFLNRLFATDGWASLLSSGQAQIGFASTSERMIRQVQHLLLRFGIVGSLRLRSIKYRETRRTAWQLNVTDQESIQVFATEIGMFGKETQLAACAQAVSARRKQTNDDLIPAEVWGVLDQARGTESWASLAQRAGLRGHSNLHVGKRGLSRPRLAALAEALNHQPLRELAASDVRWERITGLENVGLRRVYDLCIPETHNFVANDICVHNTALAMNIAEHVAMVEKKAVAIFSLEMSRLSLVQRLLCSHARVNMGKIRDGFLSARDFENITTSASKLHTAPMYIDDTSAISILELRAKSRRLKSMRDIQLIVIDYLQLLRSPSKRAQENRQLEVAEISSGIKALAKELNIPIIVLAQLNRQPEARQGGRPMLSHLRESGSIEQDADVVGLLVRSEYYADDEEEKAEKQGEAELIIAKQRNGPTGDVKLTFLKEYTRFENRAPEPKEGG